MAKPGPKKGSTSRRRRKSRRRRTSVDVSALIGIATVAHGLIGLDNLFKLDINAMGEKLKTSLMDPAGREGIIQDAIAGGKVFATLKLVNKGVKMLAGKGISFKGYHL